MMIIYLDLFYVKKQEYLIYVISTKINIYCSEQLKQKQKQKKKVKDLAASIFKQNS